jgi:hypothetical protein
MNNVIHFRPAESPRRAASGDRGAEILFFTGVRYQRGDEPPAPASQTPRARGKRQGGGAGGVEAGRKSRR